MRRYDPFLQHLLENLFLPFGLRLFLIRSGFVLYQKVFVLLHRLQHQPMSHRRRRLSHRYFQ
jgi:hypothetical protein